MYSLLRENAGPLTIPEIEDRFDGTVWARSHCRFCTMLLIHFIPDSLREAVPLSKAALRPNPRHHLPLHGLPLHHESVPH